MFTKRLFFTLLPLQLVLFTHSAALSAEQLDVFDTSLRMLWGLLIVSALILVLYVILKRRFSLFNTQENSQIKVVEIKHVMPRKSIMLIEVRGKEFLVGAGNDSINTIVPVSTKSSFESVLEKSEEKLQT